MAWEWVAPVATFAVGATGMWFTYRTSRNQLKAQVDVLVKQFRQTHSAEEIKAKRQLFADYLGALSEAAYAATIVKRTQDDAEFNLDDLEPEHRAKIIAAVAETVPKDFPGRDSEGFIESLIREASPLVRNKRLEYTSEQFGISSKNPFVSIDFRRLFSLAAQVEMVGGSKVATCSRSPIASILQVVTGFGDLEDRPDLIRFHVDKLKRAMKEELDFPG